MPKIPTFTTQARPTAEVASVQGDVRVPLTQTIGTALAPVTKTIVDHRIKEKNFENKTEALKLENEALLEFTDTLDRAGRLDNKDQAFDLIKTESERIKNDYSNRASNKYVQTMFNNNFYGEVQKGIFKTNTRVSTNIIQSLDNQVSIKKNRLLTQAYLEKDQMAFNLIGSELEKLYEDNFKGRIDVDEYNKLINGIPAELDVFKANQLITENPQQAYLNLMDQNKYPDLDISKRVQLIQETKSVLIPEIRENYKNFIAAATEGKKVPFDLKFAKEILKPKEYEKMVQEHDAVVETVDNVNIINSVNAKDLSKVTDEFVNEAKQKYPVIKAQKIKKYIRMLSRIEMKPWLKIPVLFLTQTDDNIKMLVDELAVETNKEMIVKKN